VLHVWEQDIGVFPVDFAGQGDEWSHHLCVALTGDSHIAARGTDGTDPVELGPPLSGPVQSKLLVRPDPGGIRCTVTGDGDAAPTGQVAPWRQAAKAAVALLGGRDRVFTWEAIVGMAPRGFEGSFGQLAHPQDIGPVQLVPGGICMREQAPSDRAGGSGLRYSFPVVASGQVSVYAWGRAALAAEVCLRRTCALLSLLTGAVWIPRSHPRERADGTPPLQVPPVFGNVPPVAGETEWRGNVLPGTGTFTLPGWIERAWPVLDADAGLAQAVNAIYEGMRLEPEHPSLAHLTFVAAIEGVGMRFAADRPCGCQPGCTHMEPPAQVRFRKALKTVMTKPRGKTDLRDRLRLRSHTGHRGSLFGSEQTFGYSPHLNLFKVADDAVFDYVILGELRNAGREVLAKALGRPSSPGPSAPST
jgi:hypothetical protein